tara:strand:+ start:553 stop:1167 length:615 start_codon:yes stop_codon:yes gene_type:complete
MGFIKMTKQCIFIINYNSLYEILDEIKENLPFKIIRYDNKEKFNQDNNVDKKNSLIILETQQKIPSIINFNKINFLDLTNLPLSIYKLIEIINIHLIKIKFNYKSKVIINGYELDLNSKTITNNDIILKLTEKEIEVIFYLNENKTKHGVLDLQNNIWGYSSDIETHTVETHIYRLRKKINDKFNDTNFILSHKNGYFIDQNKD